MQFKFRTGFVSTFIFCECVSTLSPILFVLVIQAMNGEATLYSPRAIWEVEPLIRIGFFVAFLDLVLDLACHIAMV